MIGSNLQIHGFLLASLCVEPLFSNPVPALVEWTGWICLDLLGSHRAIDLGTIGVSYCVLYVTFVSLYILFGMIGRTRIRRKKTTVLVILFPWVRWISSCCFSSGRRGVVPGRCFHGAVYYPPFN